MCRTDGGPKLKILFCVAGDPEIAADVYTFAYIHAHVHAHCYFCTLLRRNVSGVTHSCHTFLPFAHHMPCLNGKCKNSLTPLRCSSRILKSAQLNPPNFDVCKVALSRPALKGAEGGPSALKMAEDTAEQVPTLLGPQSSAHLPLVLCPLPGLRASLPRTFSKSGIVMETASSTLKNSRLL